MLLSRLIRSKEKLLVVVATTTLCVVRGHASSLEVDGSVGALIGGTSDGYQHIVDPANLFSSATGTVTTTDTAGSFVDPRDPNLHATSTANSAAKFGLLSEASSVSSKGYGAEASAGYGGVVASAFDIVTIHGSGVINVTLHTWLVGQTSISPDANAGARVRQDVSFSPHGFTNNAEIIGLADDYSDNSLFSHSQSGTVSVSDGEQFYVISHLNQLTGVDPLDGGLDRQELRTNSASTSANLNYWIDLSAGATLTSQSGYQYTAPAAVPEPASFATFGIGIAALVGCRRSKARG